MAWLGCKGLSATLQKKDTVAKMSESSGDAD
jgi:hypothetical protein